MQTAAASRVAGSPRRRDHQAANQETRELAPKLLSELGDLASAVGVQKLEGMSRYLERFELTVQRIQQELNGLASGVSDAAPTAQRLADSLEFLNQVVRGPVRRGVRHGAVAGHGRGRRAAPENRGAAQSAVRRERAQGDRRRRDAVEGASGRAFAAGARERHDGADRRGGRRAAGIRRGLQACGSWRSWALAAAAAGRAAWLYRASRSNARRTTELRVRENERNQEAIMRLLDELSSLADGDLTVQATVTEDITGAIADSINYAIEALRELVTTINDSAIQLDGAAKQTQAAAAHMAKASSAQSRQISAASESMADMAASIEEVSGNSERCSDVARHSVDIAHKGGDAVRRTIDGMNAIRETIQETSKRIKRLGESSQEIGNIVELINDIAEQTNILALERLDPGVHGRRGGARLRRGGGRGAATGGARGQCHQANRGAGAHHPDRYQRGGRVHGAQHHGRRGRRAARGERRRRARGDRAGLEPDREPGAEHLGERTAAGRRVGKHLEEHASGARDLDADGRGLDGDVDLDRETRGVVGAAAQVRRGIPPARLRRRHDHAVPATPVAGDSAGNGKLRRPVRAARRRGAGAAGPGNASAGGAGKLTQGERARRPRIAATSSTIPMTDISSQTLHIVAKELATTLNEARAALEAYAERSGSAAHFSRSAPTSCISAHGVLRLVEVYGAALLAEEMEHVTRYLLSCRQRPEASGRRARCADARHGAAADLPRAGAVGRPRSRARCCCRCSTICARCAAVRCCPRARCCCSI